MWTNYSSETEVKSSPLWGGFFHLNHRTLDQGGAKGSARRHCWGGPRSSWSRKCHELSTSSDLALKGGKHEAEHGSAEGHTIELTSGDESYQVIQRKRCKVHQTSVWGILRPPELLQKNARQQTQTEVQTPILKSCVTLGKALHFTCSKAAGSSPKLQFFSP